MINFGYNFILFFNNFCSVSREQEYCTNYHQCGARQVCPQVPNSTRKHTECYYGSTIGRFNCLNRMEKHPGIFNQRIYKVDDKFLLNRDLDFNETGFTCNSEKFFTWASPSSGPDEYDIVCLSKNDPGRSILWDILEELIIKDFGFQGRNYIPTSWIKE